MPKLWSSTLGDVTGFSIFNLAQTRDPLATDDSTTGVQVGHIWFNATAGALRMWSCRDATVGAAKWVFEGADYTNGGTNPRIEITQFGGGSALMAEEGNINRQINANITPGGTASDYVVGVYNLPASSFDLAGTGINLLAQGTTASNTNGKQAKLIIGAASPTVGAVVSGGTTIASTGNINTTGGAGGWQLEANIFKYGAAGSNTQKAYHATAQSGATVGALTAPTALTLTESAIIPIAVTINNATVAGDMTFDFLEVNAMN